MYKTILSTDFFDSLVHGIIDDYKTDYVYGQSKTETNDDEYLIHLSVPGLTKNDLKIAVENNYLTINHTIDKDKKQKSLFVKVFEKTYKLPKDAYIDKIDASVKDGICRIKIPKDKEKVNRKLISVS